LFGSCINHNLNTGVLKFKRKFRRQRVKAHLTPRITLIAKEANGKCQNLTLDERDSRNEFFVPVSALFEKFGFFIYTLWYVDNIRLQQLFITLSQKVRAF
jgi:hypothetical protein